MSNSQAIAGIDRTAYDFISPNERIRPLRDVIIVKPSTPDWSHTIALAYSGKALRGTVIAVGPGTYPNIHKRGERQGKKFHEVRASKAFLPTDLKVGDLVELGGVENGGYSFQTLVVDGVECVVCTEKDVTCVVQQ